MFTKGEAASLTNSTHSAKWICCVFATQERKKEIAEANATSANILFFRVNLSSSQIEALFIIVTPVFLVLIGVLRCCVRTNYVLLIVFCVVLLFVAFVCICTSPSPLWECPPQPSACGLPHYWTPHVAHQNHPCVHPLHKLQNDPCTNRFSKQHMVPDIHFLWILLLFLQQTKINFGSWSRFFGPIDNNSLPEMDY